ncbi:hypothetical protein Cfor_09467 [Coptotermes formosanus]|uniref:peptidyl-tRNA hydrolase n=1 Tax=Coptotermes formosanus TaxID=36987 RepID=A0A6L2PRA6_COPFO|nr:hypothetical protein Cfor_09467 [Coptotermes formosanus]
MAGQLVQYIVVRADLLKTLNWPVGSVPDESSLRNLESQLKENSVLHKMWIEQPEYFPTCIAVKPYPKEEVQKYFKKLRLFKG